MHYTAYGNPDEGDKAMWETAARNFILGNAARYTWRNYTALAVGCQAFLVERGFIVISDGDALDRIDDMAREAVEWPDDSTLGWED